MKFSWGLPPWLDSATYTKKPPEVRSCAVVFFETALFLISEGKGTAFRRHKSGTYQVRSYWY